MAAVASLPQKRAFLLTFDHNKNVHCKFNVKKNYVKAKGYKTTSKKLKKLNSKKKYYVQIRTYTTIKNKTYYGKWSAKKSIKVKQTKGHPA